jgi:hypothetical protein
MGYFQDKLYEPFGNPRKKGISQKNISSFCYFCNDCYFQSSINSIWAAPKEEIKQWIIPKIKGLSRTRGDVTRAIFPFLVITSNTRAPKTFNACSSMSEFTVHLRNWSRRSIF